VVFYMRKQKPIQKETEEKMMNSFDKVIGYETITDIYFDLWD